MPGVAAAVPLQGQGSAVPAAIPRALSDSSVEQSSITWESRANAINAEINKFLNLNVEMWSPSLLRWMHLLGSG